MNKTASVIFGTILVLGCVALGISLLISAIAPTAFLVYLTANPSSFSHDILKPDMTALYIFSAAEIILGLAGMIYYGKKAKN